jgi:cytosine/adenosine deaminase-related metal-dependent hydrolase
MPKVFEQDGFRFGFYSNDHEPVHVHVVKAGAEAIFDVADDVELRESHGFRLNDLAKAQQLAQENKQLILKRWHEHFGI